MNQLVRCRQCGKAFYKIQQNSVEIKHGKQLLTVEGATSVTAVCDRCGAVNVFRPEEPSAQPQSQSAV